MKPIMHRRAARLVLASGLFAVSGLLGSGRGGLADTPVVEKPVSFTSEQADRGKKRFEKECVDCHGDDLGGGMNGGAPLRGVAFNEKFADGAPASAMFLFMTNMMPPNSPGRYSATTYADLMAYILQKNGYQEGAPLPADVDALDNLIMEK